MTRAQRVLVAIAALIAAVGANAKSTPSSTNVVSVVVVHGALIDGSSWRGVYDVLARDGNRVSIVQEPLTSFEDDLAATTGSYRLIAAVEASRLSDIRRLRGGICVRSNRQRT